MAAVYELLQVTNANPATAAAGIKTAIDAVIAGATTAPKQVTVISGGINHSVNAASADTYTAYAMIQYNTQ